MNRHENSFIDKQNVMKFNLVKVFFIGMLLLYKSTYSQDQHSVFNVAPPSPNVASLGKYGEIPISHYTGIPNISVPLYEVKSGSLSMPISLSYHSGGVKVEELASSVGLGWTLNAGGVVGRSVRGMEDEDWGYFIQSGEKTIFEMYTQGSTELLDFIEEVHERVRDGEPDLFNYNFAGNSGRFMYDQFGTAHTLPYSRLKISTPSNTSISITSEEGTIYSFERSEEINTEDGCSGSESFVQSAWFLTHIESADGRDSITLEYEPVQYVYSTLGTQVKYTTKAPFVELGGDCLPDQLCLLTHRNDTYRLRKINFADGYVNFNYQNVRCDLIDDKSLDEIEIYSINNPSIPGDDVLVKKYDLSYSYFGDNSDGCNRPTEINKRLKLDSIQEKTFTSSIPPYRFEYNEDEQLPHRHSFAQDHWGYYNGETSNQGLIAQHTRNQNGTEIIIEGANRSANPVFAKTGVLEKITYPTGGTSTFIYEGNTSTDERLEVSGFTTENLILIAQTNIESISSPYLSNNSFTIPSGGAEVEFLVSGLDAIIGDDTQECNYARFYVTKDGNQTWKELNDSWNGVKEIWSAGVYGLVFDFDCYPGNGTTVNFSINVQAKIPTEGSTIVQNRYAGGLRIQRIEDRSSENAMPIVKNYRYHTEENQTLSSGVLINFPNYEHDLKVTISYGQGQGEICNYYVRTSHSNYPLATTQGSYVGYEHVIEDHGENGQKRFAYYTYPDVSPSYPFAPMDNHEFERGRIKYEIDFSKDGSSYKKLKSKHYSYNTRVPFLHFHGVRTGRPDYTINNIPNSLLPKIYGEIVDQFYEIDTWATAISSIKDTVYNPNNPSKYVSSLTEFTYDDNHYQLKDKTTYHSDGTIINKKYWYPEEYNSIESIPSLLAKNIVGIPIKEENYFNGSLGSGTVKRFDAFGKPIEIHEYERYGTQTQETHDQNSIVPSSYRKRYTINYDIPTGNIIEEKPEDGSLTAYIWGYNEEYPVIKVENADHATVLSAVSGALPSSFSDLQGLLESLGSTQGNPIQQTLWKDFNEDLRTALPNAMITTYTYNPLVGMTSITDPRGYTIYYEYDDFNRLKEVRDEDGNLVADYGYHYRGQNQH